MNHILRLLSVLLLLAIKTTSAQGAVISAPISVINNTLGSANSSFRIGNVIDQSGLLNSYVSGTTDFASYLSTGPMHNDAQTSVNETWFSRLLNLTGTIDFDLGSSHRIEQMVLWNIGQSLSRDIDGFTVFTSGLSDFSTSVNVGSFRATDQPIGNIPAEVFDLTDSIGQFVRLQITSNHGGEFTGMSELAFATSPIPEPSRAFLSLLGIGAVLVRRRT